MAIVRAAMERYIEANRAHWDAVAPVHAASTFYDLPSFKTGSSSLHQIEVAELGDVAGKSMLHLQCHIGLDTLSWARAGAVVTGVDFSSKSLELARSLAEEVHIDARFVEANVYELEGKLDETFDIVFASYGVLVWLPELEPWMRVAARFVKPGGIFYIVDDPGLSDMMEETDAGELTVSKEYALGRGPQRYEGDMDYADPEAGPSPATYQTDHTVADVVTAASAAGLQVRWVHDHGGLAWQRFSSMTSDEDGWWRLPPPYDTLPLTFSMMAIK